MRAVGEPERRFEEDALRILRLYRFAARFGFAIDQPPVLLPGTGPHLDCVSAERIQEELLKLLAAPRPGSYLEPAVLAVVLPELEPENSRNSLRNSAVPSTGSNRQRRTCPPGWRPFSARWEKPCPQSFAQTEMLQRAHR